MQGDDNMYTNVCELIEAIGQLYDEAYETEINLRATEPKIVISLTDKNITVTQYYSEAEAMELTPEEIKDKFDFLFKQENYRREIILGNVFSD